MHIAVRCHCQIDQKQCSNNENRAKTMEFTFFNKFSTWFLHENPQDVCIMLHSKMLRPGMIIFSMLLFMSTLLVEMTSLMFDSASLYKKIQSMKYNNFNYFNNFPKFLVRF